MSCNCRKQKTKIRNMITRTSHKKDNTISSISRDMNGREKDILKNILNQIRNAGIV